MTYTFNYAPHLPLRAKAVQWWRNWCHSLAARAELRNLEPQQAQAIARDVGVSRSDLSALAGKWPDSADLLTRRTTALGIDPAALTRSYPAVARDLSKTCSLCEAKRQCRSDLAAAPVNPRVHDYCPNSDTLTALAPKRRRSDSRTSR
jgi:hypothetical protein